MTCTLLYLCAPCCTCVHLAVHVCTLLYMCVPCCTCVYLAVHVCTPCCTCVHLAVHVLLYIHTYTGVEKWRRVFAHINSSLSTYEECSKDCFESVIKEDLFLWKKKGGVSKEEFDKAKKFGVHYQIIDHRLYRQPACMFSAR